MQSKNVLWLGLLFVLLLTVFCIAKYIDEFNPNIKTIATPTLEVIDQNLELQPIKIEDDSNDSEVDGNYLQIIKLVEQEEKDIEDAYNKALKQEKEKKPKTTKEQKTKKLQKSVKKVKKIVKKPLNKRSSSNKKRRLMIETIIDNQTLTAYGKLSNYDKRKLKKLTQNLQQNSSSFIRIEANRKYKKIYNIKKYLITVGIPSNKIQILYKRKKQIISISDTNDIEISIIKTSK